MKRKIICIAWTLCLSVTPGAMTGSNTKWLSGTAYVLEQSHWEIGLFQPLRYGFANRQEISTHPLLNIKMPNLMYKKSWVSIDNSALASRHAIYYPTPLLKMIAREGTGGIISPEFDIPPMISVYNEALYTRTVSNKLLLTGKVGIGLGMVLGNLDERTTIDLPLVFHRLSVYYHGYTLRFGGDINGVISRRLNYLVDCDLFIIPGADEKFAFEHKGMLSWNKTDRFQITIGYKLVYGSYPFGTYWQVVPPKLPGFPFWLPFFDLVWGW